MFEFPETTKSQDILEGLNEAQRYAVELNSGPILVIAGAGSGKTRTLVHRVANLVSKGIPPYSILLLTFTRRAAAEMLARARLLDPACGQVEGGTFHSVCHRLLRRYALPAQLPNGFNIIDRGDGEYILRRLLDEQALKERGDKHFPKNSTILELISKARNLEISLAEVMEAGTPHLMNYAAEVEEAAAGYARLKREQNLLDYDDLLFQAEFLLKKHLDLRREVSRRWRHILVDEYQDTNAVQARLVSLMAEEHKNVMAVGDDAQSIYRFRGARIKNILEFPRSFPGSILVKLEQNYRSTQPILDVANRVITGAREQYEKHLFTENQGGEKPKLLRPRDERGQSNLVLERVKELLAQKAELSQIAVLFRTSYDSYDLEIELAQELIPFVKVGGFRFLESAHIKDVLAHLRVTANPLDFVSWQRVLELLPGVGPKKAQQIIAHVALSGSPEKFISHLSLWPGAAKQPGFSELSRLLLNLAQPLRSPLEAVEEALAYYEFLCRQRYEDYPRRLRDLEELPGLARQYDSLADFMAEVVLEPPNTHAGEREGQCLTLSTVHSAKGLEWPHVLVLWQNEGRFPSNQALLDPEAMEEERRLLYVACTRAGKSLTLLAPREQYTRQQGAVSLRLSPFLAELPPEVWAGEAGAAVSRPLSAAWSAAASVSGSAPRHFIHTRQRPFKDGSKVRHKEFGIGRVVGYQGEDTIIVHFSSWGLKKLKLQYAKLEEA